MLGNISNHRRSNSGFNQPAYPVKNLQKTGFKPVNRNINSPMTVRGKNGKSPNVTGIPLRLEEKKINKENSFIKKKVTKHIRSESFNNNSFLSRSGNNTIERERTPTPTKIKNGLGFKPLGNINFSIPTLPLNKLKKNDKAGPPTSRSINKNNSFYPTNRDKLNKSTNRFSDTNSSFVSTGMKSRNTPTKKEKFLDISKSNSDLDKSINKSRISKTPINIKKNDNRTKIDSAIMKNFHDLRTKNASPVVYSVYMKKVTPNKLIRFTSNKKIASNVNVSNNTNDVSTNSTFRSKVDKVEKRNEENVAFKFERPNEVKKEIKQQHFNHFLNISNNTNMTTNNTNNKELDFRTLNTSPLLKKKVNNENLDDSKVNDTASFKKDNHKKFIPDILHETIKIEKKIRLIYEYSKVGYSGYGQKKVNQDNFFVFRNFNNIPDSIFMAVCDGHGIIGHEVSGYLRDNLPINLNNYLRQKGKNIMTHNINELIQDVFIDTNYKLNNLDLIDTTFSGSTCVSIIYTPQKLICSNVGDSRAVIGKCVNGEWISYDLSRDHKPSEKDEALRIKKKGGRIQPLREDDGEFVGPLRVWLKEDDIPGLAMTRAFGDKVAASVGVIADPEIKEYKFMDEDKFIILASDGVWEFIESDECVNIIKDFYSRNDIKGCCEYLHKESSHRWMNEEEVIDDITMIVIFLD